MNTDDYVAALGSLRRVCSSAKLPENRVVVGGLGMSCALGLERCTTLTVWVDPLGFELISALYPGALSDRHGAKQLETWIPSGKLIVLTGPWTIGTEDFSGMNETVPNRGFQHWDVPKSIRWLNAVGWHLEAQRLDKWRHRAAKMMGPHGTAGYLARRRDGKEA